MPRAFQRMAAAWGSTGTLDVLSACVALRPPTLAFPVTSLASLAPLGGGGTGGGVAESSPGELSAVALRDCLQLRPLSTVGDAFQVAKRAGLCAGDYVRAEARPASAPEATAPAAAAGLPAGVTATRPIKKDDVVSAGCAILRLQSTKKSAWQQHH